MLNIKLFNIGNSSETFNLCFNAFKIAACFKHTFP